MNILIDKKELSSLIPHAGTMCLNDAVLSWDKESLICIADTHQEKSNPLAKDHKLSSVHAIEYCAQAMAIHGGLLAREQGNKLAPGYLAAVRDVKLKYEFLDEIKSTLYISVKQLVAQAGNLIYEFIMYFLQGDDQITIAKGRATVMQMVEDK